MPDMALTSTLSQLTEAVWVADSNWRQEGTEGIYRTAQIAQQAS